MQTNEFQMLDGAVARVELPATGQQFVGLGIHPGTKAPYHWPDRSPLADLPSVSRDTCAAFIAAAEETLRKAGGQASAERRDIDREGRKVAGLKPKEVSSDDLIAEAIAHIPNNDLPYDDWIKVGLALYAALGPDGRALWEAWSAEAAKNDPAHTAEKWDSFATVHNVTVGTLFWLARQNGWRASTPRRVRTTHPSREAPDEGATEGNRPLICIRAGMVPETIDEAEQALLGAGLGLYQAAASSCARPWRRWRSRAADRSTRRA